MLSIDLGLSLLDSWPLRCALCFPDWDGLGDHERVHRQLSVSSDSKLLDEDIREEARVILRPKKPPRPKSEVFLNKEQQRRTKRYSAFGVSPSASPQRPGGILLFTIRELFANGRWIIIYFPLCNIYIYMFVYTYTHTRCPDSDFCLCSCSSVEFVWTVFFLPSFTVQKFPYPTYRLGRLAGLKMMSCFYLSDTPGGAKVALHLMSNNIKAVQTIIWSSLLPSFQEWKFLLEGLVTVNAV